MTISPLFDDDTTPRVKAADVPCKTCNGTGGIVPSTRHERRRLMALARARDFSFGDKTPAYTCHDCRGKGTLRLRDLGAARL